MFLLPNSSEVFKCKEGSQVSHFKSKARSDYTLWGKNIESGDWHKTPYFQPHSDIVNAKGKFPREVTSVPLASSWVRKSARQSHCQYGESSRGVKGRSNQPQCSCKSKANPKSESWGRCRNWRLEEVGWWGFGKEAVSIASESRQSSRHRCQSCTSYSENLPKITDGDRYTEQNRLSV